MGQADCLHFGQDHDDHLSPGWFQQKGLPVMKAVLSEAAIDDS